MLIKFPTLSTSVWFLSGKPGPSSTIINHHSPSFTITIPLQSHYHPMIVPWYSSYFIPSVRFLERPLSSFPLPGDAGGPPVPVDPPLRGLLRGYMLSRQRRQCHGAMGHGLGKYRLYWLYVIRTLMIIGYNWQIGITINYPTHGLTHWELG